MGRIGWIGWMDGIGVDGIGIDGMDVVFPECLAKDSRLTLEVWRLESQPCSSNRKRPQGARG